MSLVIVGSLAFDTIETPQVRQEKIIGGSCSYAALAASYFTSPKIVAVVGDDFPIEVIELLNHRGSRGYTERDLQLLEIFAQAIDFIRVLEQAAKNRPVPFAA